MKYYALDAGVESQCKKEISGSMRMNDAVMSLATGTHQQRTLCAMRLYATRLRDCVEPSLLCIFINTRSTRASKMTEAAAAAAVAE